MSKPIVVYLDSSDYSILSDVRQVGDDSVRQVRKFLFDALRDGVIEIRFSMVHVVEAFHRDLASHDQAIARSKLIKELSGSRVLLYFSEILRRESGGLTDVFKVAYDDQGMWHPDFPGLGKDVQDSVRAGIREAIETVPRNRKERRMAQKLYSGKSGRKALLSDPHLIRSLSQKYGMSPGFIENELFPMIVRNEQEAAVIEKAILHDVFDPVTLVSHYLDRLDKEEVLRRSVISLGERLLTVRGNMQEAIERLRSSPRFRDTARAAAARWQAGSPDRISSLRSTLQSAMVGDRLIEPQGMVQSRGLDILTNVIDRWMWDVIQPTSPRNPKLSDAGDLLHLFYLPYVDIWRGDSYSASLASRVRSSRDGVPVSNIFELEVAVRSLQAAFDR